MRRTNLLIIIVAILLLGGLIFTAVHGSSTPVDTTPAAAAVTITYTDKGFSPDRVKIKAGGIITFVNNATHVVDPASDPHPTHSDDPELNVGQIEPGKSQAITVSHVGSWGMHNHLNEGERISVTIQ